MKTKQILSGIAVLAIAMMAMWNMSFGSKTDMLSVLAWANVEALAQNETGGYGYGCSTYYEEIATNDYLNITVTCIDGGYNSCLEGWGLYRFPNLDVAFENYTERTCGVFN